MQKRVGNGRFAAMTTARYGCAVITGASSGLGEEFARQLAGKARCLVLVARRKDAMERVAAEISGLFPRLEIMICEADLSRDEDRAMFLEKLILAGKTPDLLVNNAGLGDYGAFLTSEWARVEAMLRVNVEALTHLTHSLAPAMAEAGGGAVLNVSSLASLLPIPDFAVYAATKAYVTSFSEALRIEFAPKGVKVLALCPGPVHTGFGDVARRQEGDRSIPGRQWFYVAKEQVVAEALAGLSADKARVFPHWKTAAAAVVISAVPLVALRLLMAGMRKR